MTKRISEAATLRVNPETKALRVCLISEGEGSSADFPADFFNIAENGHALGGALSFPNHPADLEHPEHRDPLSAIGSVGDVVTMEVDPVTGKKGFWADYIPSQSKPEVAAYLAEYGPKLGLSVYIESDGHTNESGKWVAESFVATDPYRSVDLVIAAGRGGKFDRVAEGLIRVIEASAPAGENEGNQMDIAELAAKVDALTTVVESLATAKTAEALAAAQVKVDDEAVAKIAESRIENYDKAVTLISEAKLTESFDSKLRGLAKAGAKIEDITSEIEDAKKIISEARAGYASDDDETDAHLGGGTTKVAEFSVPAGFGRVR